jgi:hypothetical protein
MIVDELRSLALSAVAGFLTAALVGARLGAEHGVVVVGSLVATVLISLVWCRRFRTRTCPRCGGQREWTDGYGHQRPRNCRRCGGDGRERRLGAVLQGLPKLR